MIDAPADTLLPRAPIGVTLRRADGSETSIAAFAAVDTQQDVQLLRAGGVLPTILAEALAS